MAFAVRSPRSPSQYQNKVHGGHEARIPAGNKTINTKAFGAVNLKYPSWKDGAMVARLWPALNYADPTRLMPGRVGLTPGDYSEFLVRVPAVKYVGVGAAPGEKITFLLHRPGDEESRSNCPYLNLFWAVKAAYKSARFSGGQKWDADWNPLMASGADGSAAIPGPGALFYAQASLYKSGKENFIGAKRRVPLGEDDADNLTILQLPQSAGEHIFELFDRAMVPTEKRPMPTAAQLDKFPYLGFDCGDPVGIYDPATKTVKGGAFITIFNAAGIPDRFLEQFGDRHTYVAPSSNMPRNSYDAGAIFAYTDRQTNTKFAKELSAAQVKRIIEKAQFWFDDAATKSPGLLYFPTNEEKCEWLARAFRTVPKLLQYAWADHPEYFSDSVKAILVARRSEIMPGEPDEQAALKEKAAAQPEPPTDPDLGAPDGDPALDSSAPGELDPAETAATVEAVAEGLDTEFPDIPGLEGEAALAEATAEAAIDQPGPDADLDAEAAPTPDATVTATTPATAADAAVDANTKKMQAEMSAAQARLNARNKAKKK